MSAPAFSVIIPTRDRPGLFLRALDSVLAQAWPSLEIIVADDGDGSGVRAALERGRLRPDLRLVAFETGRAGQVPARNAGVARSAGRWIAFLDDDDWWDAQDYLDAMAHALSAGAFAYASGRIVRERNGVPEGDWLAFTAQVDALSIRRDNMLLVSGIAYERALHARLGDFDETLPVYWDWDWYLRVAAAGTAFAAAPTQCVRISARADNVTAPSNESVRAAELRRLCDKHGMTGVALKNHEIIAIEQSGVGAPR